ncbi:emp24/gp25L/p24 family/GOLD-domain-containing protein [Glomus cerebriforme]|uniref:Emp24/gp25L/p24 family/GOLD-domain-containing protein n=1 Tax=Glomus cerebriforme TaxID=658196 RepID=A0A397TQL9_9GLOM|nr:emp24/gp25L/p24 family/GOLD-domain-containing protein [Glomus cerebriforme]
MRFFLALFTFLSAICLVAAHTITLPAHVRECFFEDLHTDDKMTITFQVGEGGHFDIDFWISDPSDHIIENAQKQTTGTYSLTATRDGRYTYCFSNEMSTVSEKTVSFNVHGILYVPDDGSHTDPLEKEIRELADGLAAIKDEQEYIVIREQRHRDTAESTNDRVKWWSIFQFFVLFAVCFWQVFYLKRFFEVKRVV